MMPQRSKAVTEGALLKKVFLKNFGKITEKNTVWSLFFIKLQAFKECTDQGEPVLWQIIYSVSEINQKQ